MAGLVAVDVVYLRCFPDDAPGQAVLAAWFVLQLEPANLPPARAICGQVALPLPEYRWAGSVRGRLGSVRAVDRWSVRHSGTHLGT